MVDGAEGHDYLFSRVFNFRDLGGLTGLDGRTVRWRRLFRSDSLSGLCPDDREAFAALGIRTVLDLRRPYEVERDGRVPNWDGLTWRHIHPEHREWGDTPHDGRSDLARYLADRYLDLAQEGAAGLASAIDLIADERAAPLVVHCLAGKDRTGVVCALTLNLLGVSDVDIATDYAQSTAGLERYREWLRRTTAEELTPVPAAYRSPDQAMMLFLADLRARYGSVRDYLVAAGLTCDRIEALRAHLLS